MSQDESGQQLSHPRASDRNPTQQTTGTTVEGTSLFQSPSEGTTPSPDLTTAPSQDDGQPLLQELERLFERQFGQWVRRKKARHRQILRLCAPQMQNACMPSLSVGQIHQELLRYRILRRRTLWRVLRRANRLAAQPAPLLDSPIDIGLDAKDASVVNAALGEEWAQARLADRVAIAQAWAFSVSEQDAFAAVFSPTAPEQRPASSQSADFSACDASSVQTFSPIFSAQTSFGLSRIQMGRHHDDNNVTKFGSEEQQVSDFKSLGAGSLYKFEKRDLLWHNLTQNADVPVGKQNVIDLISNSDNINRWGEMFNAIYSKNLKISLICILWEKRNSTNDQPRFAVNDNKQGVIEPLLLNWSNEHGDELDNNETKIDYYRKLLDIRNLYEINYLTYMAEGIAKLLVSISRKYPEIRIENIISNLEIFSNIDDRNVVYYNEGPELLIYLTGHAKDSARYWATAYYYVSKKIRKKLDNYGINIPIWLPSLSSYYETIMRNSFEYRKEFLSAFLVHLSVLYREDADANFEFTDIAGGLNYHWEHRSSKDEKYEGEDTPKPLGARHIGYLSEDIKRIREILDENGLSEIPITVKGTGVSNTDNDEAIPEWFQGPSYLIETDRTSFFKRRERFQAFEVWRRLGGAVVAGAEVAGWDGWMSLNAENSDAVQENGKEFYGMGLRHDETTSGTDASAARPRLSWHAYRRFMEYIAPSYQGRMINPSPLAGINMGFSPLNADCLVIFEYKKLKSLSDYINETVYIYLILIDPTFLGKKESFYFEMSIFWSIEVGQEITIIPIEPKSIQQTSLGSKLVLPEETAEYGAQQNISPLPYVVTVDAKNPIMMIQSDKSLFFNIKNYKAQQINHCPGTDMDRIRIIREQISSFGGKSIENFGIYLDGILLEIT